MQIAPFPTTRRQLYFLKARLGFLLFFIPNEINETIYSHCPGFVSTWTWFFYIYYFAGGKSGIF